MTLLSRFKSEATRRYKTEPPNVTWLIVTNTMRAAATTYIQLFKVKYVAEIYSFLPWRSVIEQAEDERAKKKNLQDRRVVGIYRKGSDVSLHRRMAALLPPEIITNYKLIEW